MLSPIPRPEFLHNAQVLNGSDFNGDGLPDYALCMQTSNGCMDEVYDFGMMLTGMLQTTVGQEYLVRTDLDMWLGGQTIYGCLEVLLRIQHVVFQLASTSGNPTRLVP